ncbi:hypothetical protein GGD66_004721 [Bradyrhizobium sp. CIR48]|nr:hypothetical protein [Bradyrhizobium sp. SBR1B]MBB4426160.1 hypothetical protein [Bradyrhizobium sp. CIR48]SFN32296.1 hypothetical protein SAMN05216573_111135 [Bradyrhizobium sp. Rc3b]
MRAKPAVIANFLDEVLLVLIEPIGRRIKSCERCSLVRYEG